MIYRDPQTGICYAAGNPSGSRHAGALGDMTGALQPGSRPQSGLSTLRIETCSDGLRITCTLDDGEGGGTLSIFNFLGQPVWRTTVDPGPATQTLYWKARESAPRRLPSGCYVVELRTGARTVVRTANLAI
jgi:hypothetical protein